MVLFSCGCGGVFVMVSFVFLWWCSCCCSGGVFAKIGEHVVENCCEKCFSQT